jgi:8-oxo-dGTP diphosphatase/2-hydroxy-dATP diphosphatase
MAAINCTLVFLIEGNNILLAMKKRGFGAGKWNGAGGKIQPGETVAEAMVRECEEEFLVSPLEFEEVGHLIFKSQAGVDDMIADIFICTGWDGEPVETEEMAPRWFKLSEIPYADMWEDDKFWLPKVLDGKFVRGTFTFDADEKILDYTVVELDRNGS